MPRWGGGEGSWESTTSRMLKSHPNKLSSAMNDEGKEGGIGRRNVRILTLLSYKENLHGAGLMISPLGPSKLDVTTKQRF